MAGGNVTMRRTESVDGGKALVGFAGVFTCGSVWICPVCNAKIMAKRGLEIGVMLAWAQRAGLQTIWGALTCRHNEFDSLKWLIDLQRDAWRQVSKSRAWRDWNATQRVDHVEHSDRCKWVCKFDCVEHGDSCEWVCLRKYETIERVDADGIKVDGRVGYIRAAELNIGANGWHPHFHPIILVRGTVQEAQWYADDIVAEWVEAVEDMGGEARSQGANGLRVLTDLEVFDALTGYVSKQTYNAQKLATEVVWSQGKTGRGRAKETLPHWSLLHSIEQGLVDEVDKWNELEEAMTGVRMVTFSRGLRDFAGLNAEQDDEEVAAEEVGTKADTVVVISAEGWIQVRDRPDVLGLLLDALEEHGWDGLKELLDFFGIEYAVPDDLSDMGGSFHESQADRERASEYATWNGEKQ